MTSYAIDIAGLNKTYRNKKSASSKRALYDIDLTVEEGAMFALLGPNGAGKSTLINILASIVDPTSAQHIRVCGVDLAQDSLGVKRALGVVPQELVMDPFFTPAQTLELHAGYYGVPKSERRTDELLHAFQLWDKRNVNARRLSGGMKRRLMTCKALVHRPRVLILDEPTAGVDIELRTQLWDYVRQLNATGTTILLTTHYLEEAEELCEQLAIINHGQIIERDSTANLLERFGERRLRIELSEPVSGVSIDGAELEEGGLVLTLPFSMGTAKLPEITALLAEKGAGVKDISTPRKDLAEVFLELTRGS